MRCSRREQNKRDVRRLVRPVHDACMTDSSLTTKVDEGGCKLARYRIVGIDTFPVAAHESATEVMTPHYVVGIYLHVKPVGCHAVKPEGYVGSAYPVPGLQLLKYDESAESSIHRPNEIPRLTRGSCAHALGNIRRFPM